MKNEIYEADYTRDEEEEPVSDAFLLAMETGFFKRYNDIMNSIPKIIVAQDKQNYEELLSRLDAHAKRKRGKIKGIVDYQKWDSHIYITLPFFEFIHKDEYELLRDLATKTNGLTFTVTEDGEIQLSVMINYFDEIGDTGDVLMQALEGNDELIDALHENAQRRKEALLEHPFIGRVIERAADNAGITAEEYIDRSLERIESDPESQMQILAELLKAREEILGENE